MNIITWKLSFENQNTFDIEPYENNNQEIDRAELTARANKIEQLVHHLFAPTEQVYLTLICPTYSKRRLYRTLDSISDTKIEKIFTFLDKFDEEDEYDVVGIQLKILFSDVKLHQMIKQISFRDFPSYQVKRAPFDCVTISNLLESKQIQLFDDRFVRVKIDEENLLAELKKEEVLERPEDWE